MTIPLEARVETVRDFFRGGESVCPYARTFVDRIDFSLIPESYRFKDIREPILRLAKEEITMAAVYVFASDATTHEKERERATVLFKRLQQALFLDQNKDTENEERLALWRITDKYLDLALALDSKVNPFLAYKEDYLFFVGMNRLYEHTFPSRYAPCSIVVITRKIDVAAVSSLTRKQIRQRSEALVGRAYEADQFYIIP